MSSAFYIPALNLMGEGALEEAARQIQLQGFKHALIVTDGVLNKIGVAASVQQLLKKYQVDSEVYDGVQPNPTVANVDAGLKILKANNSDCVVSLGGGSSHDCAKGIALLASNGGEIADYEGVDVSAKPQLPLIGINTTAGTASEMTRFCIITDEARHVKMAIVDKKRDTGDVRQRSGADGRHACITDCRHRDGRLDPCYRSLCVDRRQPDYRRRRNQSDGTDS
ncbi:hypothetical protein DZS_29200 [Dickeya ananatis]